MKKRTGLTAEQVSKAIGCTKRSALKVLNGLQVPKPWGKKAIKIVRSNVADYKRKAKLNGSTNGHLNIDPLTGLTWSQKGLKEKARRHELENAEMERALSDKWMLVQEHHKILSVVMDRIEQAPGKAKSELGLSDVQAARLAKILDEARDTAAKEIENERI